MKERWVTLDAPQRWLDVVGRSSIDPDCLVAYLDGSEHPLWIVDGNGKKDGCLVVGLPGKVYASFASK
jgi:hypothetical protein